MPVLKIAVLGEILRLLRQRGGVWILMLVFGLLEYHQQQAKYHKAGGEILQLREVGVHKKILRVLSKGRFMQ